MKSFAYKNKYAQINSEKEKLRQSVLLYVAILNIW